MKAVANKTRKTANPYASWTDPRTGWKYKLLKSWQKDNRTPYSRWFMDVDGWGHDLGDTYVSEMLPGLRAAADLTIDPTVWGSNQEFVAWAQGKVVG